MRYVIEEVLSRVHYRGERNSLPQPVLQNSQTSSEKITCPSYTWFTRQVGVFVFDVCDLAQILGPMSDEKPLATRLRLSSRD